jgi:hypothetical protein
MTGVAAAIYTFREKPQKGGDGVFVRSARALIETLYLD